MQTKPIDKLVDVLLHLVAAQGDSISKSGVITDKHRTTDGDALGT